MEKNLNELTPNLLFADIIDINKDTTEEQFQYIINRWVEKLPIAKEFKNQRNLSIAFEYASSILIKNGSYNKYKTIIEVIIYPIIRRIFERLTDETDMVIEVIKEYVDDIFNKLINSDIEAEMCSLFSNIFTLSSQTFTIGEKVWLPKKDVDSPWSDVEGEIVDVIDFMIDPNTRQNLYSVKIKDSEFTRNAFGKDLIKIKNEVL